MENVWRECVSDALTQDIRKGHASGVRGKRGMIVRLKRLTKMEHDAIALTSGVSESTEAACDGNLLHPQ